MVPQDDHLEEEDEPAQVHHQEDDLDSSAQVESQLWDGSNQIIQEIGA